MLRGIFLFQQYELDWLYAEGGASSIYPDGWDEFVAPIPEEERGDLLQAYRKRLTSDDKALQLAAAQAFSRWEGRTVTLLPNPHVIEEFTETDKAISIARIENHYMIHKGWLEEGAAASRRRQDPAHPGHHRPGPARQLHAAARRLGAEAGVAGGGAADRAGRRPPLQRAGHPRRAGARYRTVRRRLIFG